MTARAGRAVLRRSSPFLVRALNVAILLLFAGCGAVGVDSQASRLGMSPSTVNGAGFLHRLYSLPASGPADPGVRIVLLDGDGNAFLDKTTVSADPTPIHSRLLAMAPELSAFGPVTYLGRPCYHRLSDPRCTPYDWTLSRYGPAVVESIAEVVRRDLAGGQPLMLVGFSGGGVLALLVAQEIPGAIAGVVTYGAPLDVAAWTDFHGYTPLQGSLDPSDNLQSLAGFCQLHLFGDADTVLPPGLTDRWRWPTGTSAIQVASDHSCCWAEPLLEAVGRQIEDCVPQRD